MEKTLAPLKSNHSPPPSAVKTRAISAAPAPAGGFERRTRRRLSETASQRIGDEGEGEEEKDDEDEDGRVEEKIAALQKIVPGGAALGIDALFDETAGYILALQCQIKAMKVLTAFLQQTQKQNMKFGG